MRHQYLRRTHCERPSHWRNRRRDAGMVLLAIAGQGPATVTGKGRLCRGHVQYRRTHLRLSVHRIETLEIKNWSFLKFPNRPASEGETITTWPGGPGQATRTRGQNAR